MKAGSKLGLGLVLLALNTPFGLGGMSACAFLAVRTKIAMLYLVGIGIYAFSWVLFWIGLVLTGSAGPRYMKFFWTRSKRWVRAFKRTRRMREYGKDNCRN